MGRRPGQVRLGGRHGPVHRRDLRRGDVPVVRRATTTRAIAASDPRRFVDPIVSSRLRAGLGVQDADRRRRRSRRARSRPRPRIKDTGILALDGGRTHIDDADHQAMGWMTFEDAIAYSRNVVAAKVALGLGRPRRRPRRRSSTRHGLRLGFGKPTGIDLAGEVGGHRPRPGDHAVAPDRPRQRRRSARASR